MPVLYSGDAGSIPARGSETRKIKKRYYFEC